jgi:hypothetical protein
MLVDRWRMLILKDNTKEAPKRKTFRKDKEGNYWISTMRFTKGTIVALGIIGFIMSWFIAGIFFGNEDFFHDFTCLEIEEYLLGDKKGYVLHKDLTESQHLELHELVAQCKQETNHLSADSIPKRGFNLGMLGELFN